MTEATPYDDVPYFSRPLHEASVDRLASIATLFGMNPAPLEGARVLELGCAGAGHLIPMASQLPGAQFVGVDLAGDQIAVGQARVEALGLKNLDLRHMSATEIDPEFGQFDYVIAHGFYTWVPDAVRAHSLEILRSNLAPQGVGYVSFNTLPGWAFQRSLREMMRFHSRHEKTPEARLAAARSFLQFLLNETPPGTNYANQLQAEARPLLDAPGYHLLHDHLAELNQPEYFHEFMAAAQAHDLQYLGDTDLWTMNSGRLTPAAREVVQRLPDRVEREQYMDFLWRRSFRNTLLVHADVELDLGLDPARLASFHLRLEGTLEPADADPQAEAPMKLSTENVSIDVSPPLAKAALLTLQATPQGVPYGDLARLAAERLGQAPDDGEAEALSRFLLGNLMAGTVDVGLRRHPFTLDPGARPQGPAFARLAASQGDPSIPTLRHRAATLNELERRVLALADGSRDVAGLAEEVGETPAAVAEALGSLAEQALLHEPSEHSEAS